MQITGRMVFATLLVMLACVSCQEEVQEEWEACESYILTTDNSSRIFVHDDTARVIAVITPLLDDMEHIYSPQVFNFAEQIAFLSCLNPGEPPSLCVTDRAGNNLITYEGLHPPSVETANNVPILLFTIDESRTRIYTLLVSDGTERADYLFSDTLVDAEASGPVILLDAYLPAINPAGEEVAFINRGLFWDSLSDPFGRKVGILTERIDIGLVNIDGTSYRLLTGHLERYRSLPSRSWLDLCWSHDGDWIFVVAKDSDDGISDVYVVNSKEGYIHPISRDYFRFYNYFCPSPTGDTILLGTKTPYADLYTVEFSVQNGIPRIGFTRNRMTYDQIHAEPSWEVASK